MDYFKRFHLNPYRNFLAAPECPDCGEKAALMLNEVKDVFGFANAILEDHGCPKSAVFMVSLDNNYYVAIKDDEDHDETIFLSSNYTDFFAEIDGKYRLCCYGIIVEQTPGHWMVQDY